VDTSETKYTINKLNQMKRIGRLKFQSLAAALVLGVALAPSCTGEWVLENESLPSYDERVEVKFTAGTGAETRTSADGNLWLTDDEVGIYMVTTGEALSTAAISEGADNRKYRPQAATSSSALAPADDGQTIYFPSGGAVDFIAYYPWKASGEAYNGVYSKLLIQNPFF
jgi:hypothetical protein